jgi:hypothetical protein
MLGFLVDNIYVVFGDQVFQQSVGIPIGTNCAPLLADLFLYSYEPEFVQKLLRDNNKKLAVSFNHTFRYIDNVLSIINHNFHSYVDLIYPDELEIKDTTESEKSASYLDILLKSRPHGAVVSAWDVGAGPLDETLFINRGPVSQLVWHDKNLSLFKGPERRAYA